MKKILFPLLVLLAIILSYKVNPDISNQKRQIILISLTCLGFLWPFVLIYGFKVLGNISGKRISIQRIAFAVIMVVTFPLALFAYVPPEGIFIFNPDIDTRYSENYSETNFKKIELGMAKYEVQELLGEPINKSEGYADEYDEVWSYTGDGACSWSDFSWKHRWIMFNNNKVNEKYAGWSYD